MRSRRLLALTGIALGLAAGLPAPPAHAHTHPSEITVEVGKSVTFDVADLGSCAASISAQSGNPTLFTVSPDFGVGVRVTFTVTANPTTIGTGTLVVAWVGEDFGGEGPCQENSGPIPITVHVIAEAKRTSTANTPSAGESGDPVNTHNGELYFHEPADLDLGGPIPVLFRRYYASGLGAAFLTGPMGDNWRHNFQWEVRRNGNLVTVTDDRGRVDRHDGTDGGLWIPLDPGLHRYLVRTDGTDILVFDPSTRWVRRFDDSGRLTAILDPHGATLFLDYDQEGRLATVDSSASNPVRSLRFTYDGSGMLQTVREFRSGSALRTVQFAYQGTLLTGATDAAGHTTEYEYDGDHELPGLLTRRVRPEGNVPQTQTWDAMGRVATQADGDGNVTTYSYGSGKKEGTTEATLPGGGKVVWEHDDRGNLVAMTEATGRRRTFGNDDGVRRNAATTPGGVTTSWTTLEQGLPETIVDGNGDVRAFGYGATTFLGFPVATLTTETSGDGLVDTYTRNAAGRPLTLSEGGGTPTVYTWNEPFGVATITDPKGGVRQIQRNAAGDIVSTLDPEDRLVTITRDAHGRETRRTFPGGGHVDFEYDAMDRVTRVTDETGVPVDREYDDNGNLVRIAFDDDSSVGFEYDAMDRLRTVIDEEGGRTTFEYDNRGFLSRRTRPDGSEDGVTTDDEGNIIATTDASGARWTVTPGDDGRPAVIVDPTGGRTAFTYDGEGRLLTRTDADGNVESVAYDGAGRVVSHRDGSGVETTIERDDPRGAITRITVGGLLTVEYGRDECGRLVSLSDGDGTTTFEYDGSGRLEKRIDPFGNDINYEYDTRGRHVFSGYSGALGFLTRVHDARGNLQEKDFSDGVVIEYEQDVRGRLVSATGLTASRNLRGDVTYSEGASHARDSMGRMTTAEIDQGKTITYTWDERGIPATVSDGLGGSLTWHYDDLGRVTSITRSNGVTTTFTRDAAGRPLSMVEGKSGAAPLASLGFVRDGAGRILEEMRDLPLEPGLDFATDESVTGHDRHRINGRTYDLLGRTLSGAGRTFQWDLAGRCTSMSDGETVTDFAYDAFGYLLAAGDTGYVWSWGYERPAVVRMTENENTTRFFVRAPDGSLLWSMNAAGADRRWYHFDAAGNTLFLTDDAGAVTDAFAYGPFGEFAGRTGSHGTPYTFGGRHGVITEAPGLYRMGRRLYDAGSRTFLSPDWIPSEVTPFAVNPYQYADGDPLSKIDPTGELPEVSAGDAANGSGLVGEILSQGSKLLPTGSGLSKGLSLAGDAGGLLGAVGAPLEVMNSDERTDRVIKRFQTDSENARHDFDLAMENLRRSLKRRLITMDEYNSRRRTYLRLLHDRQEAAEDDAVINSAINATVTTMNIVTGYVPGGGFLVNWADHYGFNNIVR